MGGAGGAGGSASITALQRASPAHVFLRRCLGRRRCVRQRGEPLGNERLLAGSTDLSVGDAIDASGGKGGAGGSAMISFTSYGGMGGTLEAIANGNNGGGGGDVYLSSSNNNFTATSITSRGGDGGAGLAPDVQQQASITGDIGNSADVEAVGGEGNSGGYVNFSAGNQGTVSGAIDLTGGKGGAGGTASFSGNLADNSSAYVYAYGGRGGSGGDGGEGYYGIGANFSASGALAVTGAINASGGAGGAGGSASIGSASSPSSAGSNSNFDAEAYGGDGGGAGSVYLSGGSVNAGSTITAQGGAGGTGGSASITGIAAGSAGTTSFYADASGGFGGYGSEVNLSAASAASPGSTDLSVGDAINTSGGNGAAGGSATISFTSTGGGTGGSSSAYANGGYGGSGGSVYLTSSNNNFSATSITGRGGDGGAGGTASLAGNIGDGVNSFYSYVEAQGNDGGYGGNVNLTAGNQGTISGAIDLTGGKGAAGGTASFSGNIGNNSSVYLYGYGGDGGEGSSLYADMSGALTVSGATDFSAGAGGKGGSAIMTGNLASLATVDAQAYGGYGGSSGYIQVYSPGPFTMGAVTMLGGAGGAGGTAQYSGTIADGAYVSTYANGGGGGYGGSVYASLSGGNIQIGATDLSGAGGGAGGTASASYTGGATGGSGYYDYPSNQATYVDASGGYGGSGGSVNLSTAGTGTGTITIGSLTAPGGAGAVGGNASETGDSWLSIGVLATGGRGGGGGSLSLNADSQATVTGAVNLSGAAGASGGTASLSGNLLALDYSEMYNSSYGTTAGTSTTIDASGGSGGSGGYVNASGNQVMFGSTLSALGGSGGAGGSATLSGNVGSGGQANAYGNGMDGGEGGSLYADMSGALTVSGATDFSTGTGGKGGSAIMTGNLGTLATLDVEAEGGYGGWYGYVQVYSPGPFTMGAVTMLGGAGGAGGTAQYSGTIADGAYVSTSAYGGGGGYGGSVYASLSGGNIQIGATDLSGAGGGAGGTASASYTGGATGGSGYYDYPSNQATYVDASGGYGGSGGSVNLSTAGSGTGTITLASLTAPGGAGAVGGKASVTGDSWLSIGVYAPGGSGGGGGNLSLSADNQATATGAVNLSGAAGASGGTASLSGNLLALDYSTMYNSYLGTTAGTSTTVDAGGGYGGYGGSIDASGNQVTFGSTLSALGGVGGAGGAATLNGNIGVGGSANAYGNGGDGGEGGYVSLNAPGGTVNTGGLYATGGLGGNSAVSPGSNGPDGSWNISGNMVTISDSNLDFMPYGSVTANVFEFDPVNTSSLSITPAAFIPLYGVSTVKFGNGTTTADLTLSGTIDLNSNNNTTLSLVTSGALAQQDSAPGAGDAALTVTNLYAQGGSVSLAGGPTGNDVAKLRGNATSGTFEFYDNASLNIGFSDPNVTSGAAGISASGNVSLNSGGTLTQSAPLNLQAALAVNAGSDVILTDPGNQIGGRIDIATTGVINLNAEGNVVLGQITASGAPVEISAGGTISGAAANITAGDVTLTSINGSAAGTFAISTGVNVTGTLTASVETSSDIQLDIGSTVPSSLALTPATTGRWLVYSSVEPSDPTLAALAYNFKQYAATFGGTVLGTGNGLLFNIAPSLMPSLSERSASIRRYDDRQLCFRELQHLGRNQRRLSCATIPPLALTTTRTWARRRPLRRMVLRSRQFWIHPANQCMAINCRQHRPMRPLAQLPRRR